MSVSEAQPFIGKTCEIRYLDRAGRVLEVVSHICDVTYVPLYGAYLVTDTDDIRLDRICRVDAVQAAIEPTSQGALKVAA